MTTVMLSGMIGLGKTSVTNLLGKALNLPVYYEKVDNNMVLKRFYTATQEEIETERLPIQLQYEFLVSRFETIKQVMQTRRGILDRSIYEDKHFAKSNLEYGKLVGENRVTDLEFAIYESVFDSMMHETEAYKAAHGTKAPNLMIYLKGSFDTVMKRIKLRGRDYEQDSNLIDYYHHVWKGYDDWAYNQYTASQIITIDMDNTDVVNNKLDAERVTNQVKEALKKEQFIYA